MIELLVAKVRGQQEQIPSPVDMLSLAGISADLRQKIDVDAYLAQERASWNAYLDDYLPSTQKHSHP